MESYNGITVGSLVKANCFKGFLRVTAIERRFYTEQDEAIYNREKDPNSKFIAGKEYNPLIRFNYEYEENGKPSKRKSGSVDASYVILAKDYIANELKRLQELEQRLKEIYNEL